MMIFDQNSNGQHFDLPVGQVAELRLSETPTTGYRWAVTSAPSPACNLSDERFTAEAGPPGHGGHHTWRLSAVATGNCDIQLTCRRSFAPDASGNAIFSLHLRVTAAPAK